MSATSEADVETAVEDLRDHLGPVDILVNNAGITGKAGKLWELSKSDWETVLSVNTIRRKGKVKRTRMGTGKRPDQKRAVVTLAEGDTIEIFEAKGP